MVLEDFHPKSEALPPTDTADGASACGIGPASDLRAARKTRVADCAKCVLRRGLVRAKLPDTLVMELCQRMWLVRARKRQVLFSEGSPARQLFALRKGAVKLLRMGTDGRPHVTAVLEAGTIFGCEALFDHAYHTDAEMLIDGEVCVADAPALDTMLREAPSLGLDLARFLHQQLATARQRLAVLGAGSARARVAGHLLLRLADAAEDGCIRQDLTQEDLGGMLGLSSETVCRTIAELRERGAIACDRQLIRVRDAAMLEHLAQL